MSLGRDEIALLKDSELTHRRMFAEISKSRFNRSSTLQTQALAIYIKNWSSKHILEYRYNPI